MPNRLAGESSPYLLQHQHNPVDWYPWGEDAFARARALDKPLFVSIGYAACHWCHVMERESFEDEAIAAIMNESFINVKVDREERPDVDSIYMNAIQLTGQGGGWPLSAFCTPEGEPFYLGTYFPPDDRFGRPGFPRVLQSIATAYREDREKVDRTAGQLLEGLQHFDAQLREGTGSIGVLRSELIADAGKWLAEHSDPEHGGIGTAPKFPSSSMHALLARASRLPGCGDARAAFFLQARCMARGGIYDHVGGGFARYSVDAAWVVPHFEKMLYDNAQLLGIYADAFSLSGSEEWKRIIESTLGWLEREMQHSCGGFYASQDADSEGEEGTFYVWRPEEVRSVLGDEQSTYFMEAFPVTEQGNFEKASTVLVRKVDPADEASEARLRDALEKLRHARGRRVPPATDTKVLSSWNGLLLLGLVRAWESTGIERALELARDVAGFLESEMIEEEGLRLFRVWKDGRRKLDGTLEDYAFVAEGLMALAEATDEAKWWEVACRLLDSVLERFYEEVDGVGVFYMTPSDSDEPLVHRPVSAHDNAMPAGASVAVACLLRRAFSADDERSLAIAERYLAAHAERAAASPFTGARLLAALDLYLHATTVVVTEGDGKDALLEALRRSHAAIRILEGSWSKPKRVPRSEGASVAYLCRGQMCSAPIRDPQALAAELAQLPSLSRN